nr:capsid VP1 [Horse parvovirus CSF]
MGDKDWVGNVDEGWTAHWDHSWTQRHWSLWTMEKGSHTPLFKFNFPDYDKWDPWPQYREIPPPGPDAYWGGKHRGWLHGDGTPYTDEPNDKIHEERGKEGHPDWGKYVGDKIAKKPPETYTKPPDTPRRRTPPEPEETEGMREERREQEEGEMMKKIEKHMEEEKKKADKQREEIAQREKLKEEAEKLKAQMQSIGIGFLDQTKEAMDDFIISHCLGAHVEATGESLLLDPKLGPSAAVRADCEDPHKEDHHDDYLHWHMRPISPDRDMTGSQPRPLSPPSPPPMPEQKTPEKEEEAPKTPPPSRHLDSPGTPPDAPKRQIPGNDGRLESCEKRLLEALRKHKPEGECGGWTWPGKKYCGPGNKIPCGPPADKVDECSARHDIGYDKIIKEGKWPYGCQGCGADSKIIECLKDDDSLLSSGIKGLWTIKCKICKLTSHVPSQDASEDAINACEETLKSLSTTEPEEPPTKQLKTETITCPENVTHATPQGFGPTGPGGGGGGCGLPTKGIWKGGVYWEGTHVLTKQTRQCQLTPYPTDYTTKPAVQDSPGIIVLTPWKYLDINMMSSNWPPSAYQILLETADALRPKTLKITIEDIVGKDITKSDNCTNITDSCNITILVTKDDGHKFPYVLGGGQTTVPGHLPGGNYYPSRYAYRTVGSAKKDWYKSTTGGAKSSLCPGIPFPWQATQNTELFILENQDLTIIRPGGSFTVTYEFPDLPSEQTTQYMWDTRRNDNPWAKQRLKVARPLKKGLTKIQSDESGSTIPNALGLQRRNPAMWLATPRPRDGDLLIIPSGKEDAIPESLKTYGRLDPLILMRDTLHYTTNRDRVASQVTLQPGPRTQDTAIMTPDGTLVLTSNTMLIRQEREGINIKEEANNLLDTNERLVLHRNRGYDGPAEPLHIREHILARIPTLQPEDWEHYDMQLKNKEITLGAMAGLVVETQSGHLEAQIWQREPNTDRMIPGGSPIALWSMKTPPPTIYLRMLPTMGPPNLGLTNTGLAVLNPSSFLDQYVNFNLKYEIGWEIKPRNRNTTRWNPQTPVELPLSAGPIFTLTEDGTYNLPPTTWQLKNRPRAFR